MGKRTCERCVLVLALALLGPLVVSAQGIKGSLQVRSRAEHWDWFESSTDGNYTYLGSLLRAAASQQGKRVDWRVELGVPLLLNLPAHEVAPAPQGAAGLGPVYWAANDSAVQSTSLFLKQAFLRLTSRRDSSTRSTHAVRLGRFEFIEGLETVPEQPTLAALERDRIAHRLLGNFGWSHVQRSFDGVQYAYDGRTRQLTLLAARATQGVFKTNGWPDLDVSVGYVALNGRPHPEQQNDWRMFALLYRDARAEPVPLKADNRPLTLRQSDLEPIEVATLGGHYVRLFSIDSTTIDLLAWGALQAGDWGALSHRAYAAALEAGWQPRLAGKPWLRLGYTRTSGDEFTLDDQHGTFFQVLPTPRLYARFPVYNLMNIEDAFVSLLLRPSARLKIRTEAHRLALTERNDLWYSGGGAYDTRTFGYTGRPANGENGLGTLLDLSTEVNITSTLTLNGYLGWLRGGSVIEGIYPAGRSSTLGYLELEWRR